MSYLEQVGCKPLWTVAAYALDPEPFAYITQRGDTYQAEDVDDGPLGSRRTLEEAHALVDQHAAACDLERIAHNARVDRIAAEMDAATDTPAP